MEALDSSFSPSRRWVIGTDQALLAGDVAWLFCPVMDAGLVGQVPLKNKGGIPWLTATCQGSKVCLPAGPMPYAVRP